MTSAADVPNRRVKVGATTTADSWIGHHEASELVGLSASLGKGSWDTGDVVIGSLLVVAVVPEAGYDVEVDMPELLCRDIVVQNQPSAVAGDLFHGPSHQAHGARYGPEGVLIEGIEPLRVPERYDQHVPTVL